MSYYVEKDWTTKAGHRAVVIVQLRDDGTKVERCGYVAVSPTNPLFGKDYHEQIPEITQEIINNRKAGKNSFITLFCAGVGADEEGKVRRSLDLYVNCHGGLTYAGDKNGKYPVAAESWWFGFDCGHAGDAQIEPARKSEYGRFPHEGIARDLPYCEAECESIAQQLFELVGVV